MLYHPPPETHCIYLDQSATGAQQISVGYAGKRKRQPSKRIITLVGAERDAAYPALSQILSQHTKQKLETQAKDLPPGEYHRFDEYCANQMLMAMEAIRKAKDNRLGQTLAQAVAAMHDCEAGWWYALFTNRNRKSKVIQALELLYA